VETVWARTTIRSEGRPAVALRQTLAASETVWLVCPTFGKPILDGGVDDRGQAIYTILQGGIDDEGLFFSWKGDSITQRRP